MDFKEVGFYQFVFFHPVVIFNQEVKDTKVFSQTYPNFGI
jgi:hypothetical protein